MILSNVVLVIIMTMLPSNSPDFENIYRKFELASLGVFTLEYCARLWSCVEEKEYALPVKVGALLHCFQ